METAVHFGAGAIGRGLIGYLLHYSGYRLVFSDTDETVIEQINRTNSYDVILMDEGNKRVTLDCVYALNSKTQEDQIIKEIVKAKILTTSVRVENLKYIAPLIAKALKLRKTKTNTKIDILAYENAFMASSKLKNLILKNGISEEELNSIASFANTVTDRVVKNLEIDGESVIEIGASYEATIGQTELSDPHSKPIKDVDYVDNISLYVERKLFLVNGGHYACAIIGNLLGYTDMDLALRDDKVMEIMRGMMEEVGAMLNEKYSIPEAETNEYITFVIERYLAAQNHDEVSRVSRNPKRKLSKNDRIVAPALELEKRNMPFESLATVIAAGYLYNNKKDSESVEIQKYIEEHSIDGALVTFSELEIGSKLYQTVLSKYQTIKEWRK